MIFDPLGDILSKSLEEHTIVWIAISGIIGGIITQLLKFVFENKIPEWQKRKATRIAIQKYSPHISQIISILVYSIKTILGDPSLLNEDRKLFLLYKFGCLFAWIQILQNETSFEFADAQKSKSYRKMAKYLNQLNELIMSFCYDYLYSNKKMYPQIVSPLILPRNVLVAIGELMINKTDNKNDEHDDLINFIDFIKNYQESNEFKKWFIYLENFICGLHASKVNPQWNMLILILVNLFIFIYRNTIRELFPLEWMPSKIQLILSKILWLPNKIITIKYILQFLVNAYRFSPYFFKSQLDLILVEVRKSQYKIILQIFFKLYHFLIPRFKKILRIRKEEEEERKNKKIERENDNKFYYQDSIYLKKFSFESNFDSLVYNTIAFEPGYMGFINYMNPKNNIIHSIIYTLFPHINIRFIDSFLYSLIISKLKVTGFIDILTKFFDSKINYYDNFISKSCDSEKKADALNKMGILYTYLIDVSKHSEKESHFKAFNFYDKSIELNTKIDSLINKGLWYLEMHNDNYDLSNKSMECFKKAIEIIDKGYTYYDEQSKADIWNNIGIIYYIQKQYNQSMECFEKAIETNKQFEPAYNNLKIVYEKLYTY